MNTNAKLEFYRFNLNHKEVAFKTFRDFAIEVLKIKREPTDEKVMKAIFDLFIKELSGKYAKRESLQKKLSFEKKKTINKYYDKGPIYNSSEHTIFGVINGGPYGRDRIVSNNDDENDSVELGKNKAVLLYFYFFLYTPPDHNEGFFMIHSNSRDESITSLFRSFATHLFKGTGYRKPVPIEFCPSAFQEEFKSGAILKNMTFRTTYIDDTHSTEGMKNLPNEYIIKIEATPQKKDIPASVVKQVRDVLVKTIFGTKTKNKKLDSFERTTLVLRSGETKASEKTFEWNSRDNEFVPVVYLKGKVKKQNPDGTPDFDELRDYCKKIFETKILQEIRPDLHVTKSK